MKRWISTKGLSTEEWLRYRRLGIGGSDASTILGLNPYNSILRLWEDKTGRYPVEKAENEYTHFGHVMEPIIRREFERRTGSGKQKQRLNLNGLCGKKASRMSTWHSCSIIWR